MSHIFESRSVEGAPIYQLKITLKWSKPPIWRRVLVWADMPLDQLHDVIQAVMGWTDSHLHQFIAGRTYYGTPNPEFGGWGMEVLDERRYIVADLAPAAKKKFIYEYDFGDGWEHEVLVEKVLPPDSGVAHPVCVAGENACPMEDCGGIYGYYNLLKILADPKHPEHEEMKEWAGGNWDAARFDLDYVNTQLKRFKNASATGDAKSFGRKLPTADNQTAEDNASDGVGSPYQPPLDKLLRLGEPRSDESELQCAQFGITREHAAELIRMATDTILLDAPTDDPRIWAPIYAWRALRELRPPEAIEPLLGLLKRVDVAFDDWVADEIPEVLAAFGATAIAPVKEYLANAEAGENSRIETAHVLSQIAENFPETRGECVAALTSQLERFHDQSEALNGFLINYLLDLKAVEAAPLMERAFAAERVDEMVCGDWEDVAIELGLKTKRERPRKSNQYTQFGEQLREALGVELTEDGKVVSKQPPVNAPFRRTTPKIGRNDPCPCGSGRKYKNCCGI